MKKVLILGILPLLFSCSVMEFEVPPKESVVSAYINKEPWEADSLNEAYYYEKYLFISAKDGEKSIIIKIENPVVGDNQGAEVDLIDSYTGEVTKSAGLSVYLNVLDTVNAQPSIVNGTFNGLVSDGNGKEFRIQEGKIKNAVTKDLFCENNLRSMISSNKNIGGQWELVRVINRKTSQIQNPTCNSKVLLNMFTETYMPADGTHDFGFRLDGPQNSLSGSFAVPNSNTVLFSNAQATSITATKYNAYLENLVFNSLLKTKAYYINNSLMHLESDEFVIVFFRRK
jgi:hypothetical protein